MGRHRVVQRPDFLCLNAGGPDDWLLPFLSGLLCGPSPPTTRKVTLAASVAVRTADPTRTVFFATNLGT
jgi:hypothetical protein